MQHAETIGFVTQITKQQALEILQARVSAVSQQLLRPSVTTTLSEFVRAEWKPNAELALKKSSMRIYSYQLEKHILPTLGELPVRNLGVAQIEACLSQLKQKGHATSTLRSVRSTFATVLRSAVKRGYRITRRLHGTRTIPRYGTHATPANTAFGVTNVTVGRDCGHRPTCSNTCIGVRTADVQARPSGTTVRGSKDG